MAYFSVTSIAPGTWQIREPLGVSAFLFEGRERALLSDTCNGFMDIRKTLRKLTHKPLIVMNTHGHSDHAGGNNQFEEIYIRKEDRFMLNPAWQQQQQDLLFGYAKKAYPVIRPLFFYFKLQRFKTYKPRIRPLKEGHAFDLGGRVIHTLHTPGHTPGSVVLLDEQTRTVYAGDAVNNGMFLFFEGCPTPKEYAATLQTLTGLSGYDRFCISHSKEPLPFSYLNHFIGFLERASLKKSSLTDLPNYAPVYKCEESGEEFSLSKIEVLFTENNI
jgi:glyoxylase-like metal-dependent hydrolase (beta-lactamase superfamily II)